MGAHVMALPPMNPVIRAGGLPIRLLAENAIRRARAALAKRAVPAPTAPAEPPETPPAGEPAQMQPAATSVAAEAIAAVAEPAIGIGALERTLRGFTILELYVEARRLAIEAALHHEHLEGLAAGRTYGDRSLLPGFSTPDSYRVAAFEAKRRAEMAGAAADFLRGMLDHERALADLLIGGERV